MTTPKTRREQEFEAFKKAWEEYPSQDNEGFVPDRGGFKCGWFAALQWIDSTPAPSEVGDGLKICVGYMDTSEFSMMINENPNGGFKWEFLDFLDPKKQEGEVTKIFISTTDPSQDRRTQNAEVKKRAELIQDARDNSPMDASQEAAHYNWLDNQNEKLTAEISQLRALLERAKEIAEYVKAIDYTESVSTGSKQYHWGYKNSIEWLSDYERMKGDNA